MAIVPVSKVTFYGITDEKEAVLDGLQRLGCAHVVNLNPGMSEGRPERGYSVEAHEALQYLRTCPIQRQQAKNPEDFDFAAVERETLEIRQREQELRDERDFVREAIEIVEPWGEFHLPAEEEHGGLRFWFYVVPHYRMETIQESGLVWQAVARDERFDYVVVVHPEEPQGIPGTLQNLDPRSLSQLTRRMEEVELELEKLHWRRVELTRWCHVMTQAMVEADDRAVLEHAGRQTLDVSRVFAVRGWAPRRSVPQIEKFAEQRGLALAVDEPGPEDNPPTLLDNPEFLAGGESTVTFYMTPGYHTWDPSVVVFFSFAVFFAMIFSDAGYGLMLGAVLIFTWRRLGHTRSNIRLRNLFLVLVIASVAYGVMVGSYFGVNPAEGSMLASLKVLDTKDQDGMMGLSILVGVFHLVLANLVTAWRYRRSLRFLAPLGWVAMILGGLIAAIEIVGGDPLELFLPVDVILLIGGAAAILLFSSQRPFSFRLLAPLGWVAMILGGLIVGVRIVGNKPPGLPEIALLAGGVGAVLLFSRGRPLSFGDIGGLVRRLLEGLQALTGVSKAFGDVLSYLRLFALGLASTQLAATFNDIAGSMTKTRGIGLLLAILILIFGHGLNFMLAVMGGVVHGLRLNCIEFFNWSLPEEGYPFQPFCKKASQ